LLKRWKTLGQKHRQARVERRFRISEKALLILLVLVLKGQGKLLVLEFRQIPRRPKRLNPDFI